jgi:hypothetical protein
MLTTTRLALVVTLMFGAAAAAQAQVHSRHTARQHERALAPTFQSRNVSMPREVAPSAAEERWMDRASDMSGPGY